MPNIEPSRPTVLYLQDGDLKLGDYAPSGTIQVHRARGAAWIMKVGEDYLEVNRVASERPKPADPE